MLTRPPPTLPGGGAVAAKHAERIIANTPRQELVANPCASSRSRPAHGAHRVGFPTGRARRRAADRVYEGVAAPLVAEDAEAIVDPERLLARQHRLDDPAPRSSGDEHPRGSWNTPQSMPPRRFVYY